MDAYTKWRVLFWLLIFLFAAAKIISVVMIWQDLRPAASCCGAEVCKAQKHHFKGGMMARRLFVCMTALASLLVAWCPQVWAQHQHELTLTVDGSKTPELISDDVAYDNLLTILADAPEHQVGFSNVIHLTAIESLKVSAILADLRLKHRDLVNTAGSQRDHAQYNLQRRQLIDSIKLQIDLAISPVSRALFHTYAQQFKRHIKIYGGLQ